MTVMLVVRCRVTSATAYSEGPSASASGSTSWSALWTSTGPYWLGRAALEPGVAVTLLERLELRCGYRIFPRWGEVWLQDISSEPELGVVTQSRGGFIFSLDFRL